MQSVFGALHTRICYIVYLSVNPQALKLSAGDPPSRMYSRLFSSHCQMRTGCKSVWRSIAFFRVLSVRCVFVGRVIDVSVKERGKNGSLVLYHYVFISYSSIFDGRGCCIFGHLCIDAFCVGDLEMFVGFLNLFEVVYQSSLHALARCLSNLNFV